MATQPNSKATLALVTGIISIVLCWIPLIGTVLGILAIVFANQSRSQIAANPDLNHPRGTTGGLAMGIIGLVASIIFAIYYIGAVLYFFIVAASGVR